MHDSQIPLILLFEESKQLDKFAAVHARSRAYGNGLQANGTCVLHSHLTTALNACKSATELQPREQEHRENRGLLTSVGLRRERCSGATLGSVTRAPLSRLGVLDEGSQESPEPADPFAAPSIH